MTKLYTVFIVAFIAIFIAAIHYTDKINDDKCNKAGGQIITGQGYKGFYHGCIYPAKK